LKIAETNFAEIEPSRESLAKVEAVFEEAVKSLLGGRNKNVVGVFIGISGRTERPLLRHAIQVHVVKKLPRNSLAAGERIPRYFRRGADGYH